MAQQLKILTAQPDELNWIPETHMGQKELIPARCPDLHIHSVTHMCTYTYNTFTVLHTCVHIHKTQINKCNVLKGMILRMMW